jgi:nucleoside-diphosphate-sugar epimerase
MDKKKFLIFGCGWLGFPLAQQLIEKGHTVFGTTTTAEKLESLQKAGIHAALWHSDGSLPDFIGEEFDFFIFCVPPGKTGDYAGVFARLAGLFSQRNEKSVFVSSISVYENSDKIITEESPVVEKNPILAAETALRERCGAMILRAGGLMGKGRFAAKYFAEKTVMQSESPVNYVYADDMLQAVLFACENFEKGEIFNLVAPEHPIKREVVRKQAAMLPQYSPANYDGEKGSSKLISSEKIIGKGFVFSHTNPVNFPLDQEQKIPENA